MQSVSAVSLERSSRQQQSSTPDSGVLSSGFWGVREQELSREEMAAAIALAVHRGVITASARRILPVGG
jgi:hypothetical protein